MSQRSSIIQIDNSIPCHVCKMEIPKLYIHDHMKSTLHNNNVQIMDIALERSKEYIKINYQFKFNVEQLDDEFCDICNVSYSYVHKLKHKTSDRHKKLAIYNKILPKICVLLKDVANNLDAIDEIKEILNETEKTTINKAIDEKINKDIKRTLIDTRKGMSNGINIKETGANVCKDKPIEKVKETVSKISNTNTINRKNDMTYCDICKVYKSSSGFISHMQGLTHRIKSRRLNIPEQFPNSTNIQTQKTYCDVCNVFKGTESFDLHLDSPQHKNRVYGKLLTENHFTNYITNGPKVESKHCRVCKIYINIYKTLEHVESEEHLDKYKSLLRDYNIIKVGNDYFCPTCDVFESDVVKHITDKHIYLFLFYYETFCDVCRIKVPEANLTLHNQGRLHLNNVNKDGNFKYIGIHLVDTDNIKKMITVDNVKLKCKICDTLFYDSNSIVTHMKSDKHKICLKDLYVHNAIENRSARIYRCNYCNVLIDENVLEHVNSKEHKEKVLDDVKKGRKNNPDRF